MPLFCNASAKLRLVSLEQWKQELGHKKNATTQTQDDKILQRMSH